jgi:small-conductance mechanosensitive channel
LLGGDSSSPSQPDFPGIPSEPIAVPDVAVSGVLAMAAAMETMTIIQEQLADLYVATIALVPNVIAGAVVVLATWLVVLGFARTVAGLLRRSRLRASLVAALLTLTRSLIWLVGLLITATIVFPNLTPAGLLTGLGLGSLAVGLAFRDIFENFLAGILILIREPMQIGDDILCQGIHGRVEQITIRDTYIRKRSGELVLLPNSFLFKNPIEVLTDRPKRRIELIVGVAYGENVDAARQVIRDAFADLETVDRTARIDVFAREFNSSSMDFLVRWWTGSTPIEEHRSRDEVAAAIKAALDRAGIEIPFPYRTLVFKEPLRVDRDPDAAR